MNLPLELVRLLRQIDNAAIPTERLCFLVTDEEWLQLAADLDTGTPMTHCKVMGIEVRRRHGRIDQSSQK